MTSHIGKSMKITLNKLIKGQYAIIIKINTVGEIKRRLLDMGLVKGTSIKVERIAPLGDPIEIKVKGYMLSLRKEEAKQIEVETE
ncbi:MAG: ferrous iron transport protein A [Nanoarchaeota archaeon]